MAKLKAKAEIERLGKSQRLEDEQGVVQSVIFDPERWTEGNATTLLVAHGRTGIVSEKRPLTQKGGKRFLRFQQQKVDKFKTSSFRTVKTRFAGVRAIVGERENPQGNFLDRWIDRIEP